MRFWIRHFVAAATVTDFMLKMQKVKDWRIMDFAPSWVIPLKADFVQPPGAGVGGLSLPANEVD